MKLFELVQNSISYSSLVETLKAEKEGITINYNQGKAVLDVSGQETTGYWEVSLVGQVKFFKLGSNILVKALHDAKKLEQAEFSEKVPTKARQALKLAVLRQRKLGNIS